MSNYPAQWQRQPYPQNWIITERETEIEYENTMLIEMHSEIARLQERVRFLEEQRANPSNAFWGQIVFDVFVAFGFLSLAVWLL